MSDDTTNDNLSTFIRRVTRTRSGLRLWFSDLDLVGEKFLPTVCDGNLLLDQVRQQDPGIRVSTDPYGKKAVWSAHTMRGSKLNQQIEIYPSGSLGKFAFIIPEIPELEDHRDPRRPPASRRLIGKQNP